GRIPRTGAWSCPAAAARSPRPARVGLTARAAPGPGAATVTAPARASGRPSGAAKPAPLPEAADRVIMPGPSPGIPLHRRGFAAFDRHAEAQTTTLLRCAAAGLDLRGGADLRGARCACA